MITTRDKPKLLTCPHCGATYQIHWKPKTRSPKNWLTNCNSCKQPMGVAPDPVLAIKPRKDSTSMAKKKVVKKVASKAAKKATRKTTPKSRGGTDAARSATTPAKKGTAAAATGKHAGKSVGKKTDKPGQKLAPGFEEEKVPKAVEAAAEELAVARKSKLAARDRYKTAHAAMDKRMREHNVSSYAGCGLEVSVSDSHKLLVKELKDK